MPFLSFASEVDLLIPDLHSSVFAHLGLNGWQLLFYGIIIIILGMVFGLRQYLQIKKFPVHKAMSDVSHIIYTTCKTYLKQQGKFLVVLLLIIGVAIFYYFYGLSHLALPKVLLILGWSVLGVLGSYAVSRFGVRINTLANSRTAFAALRSKPRQVVNIPLKSGMSIGVLLICVELILMLVILLFMPRESAGACFIGFAIGESLGASALRIA
jgi:K(+)-stimulated pyrophosphate-energized sodium pump